MGVVLTNELSLKNRRKNINQKKLENNSILFKRISLFSGEIRNFEKKIKIYIELDSPIRLIQEKDKKDIKIQIGFASQKFNTEDDFDNHIKYLNNIKKDIQTICDLFKTLNIKLKK